MSGSYKVTVATRGSALEPLERWLLTCVGMRAGEDGTCWASVATLVDDSGISERALQDTLRRLVALGALERQNRKGDTAVYRIRMEGILPTGPRPEQAAPYWKPRASRTPAGAAPPQLPHPTPAAPAPPPVQEPHPTPAAPAPNSSSDPSSRSVLEEREDARPRAGGDLLSDPAALRAVLTERHAQALGDLLEHAQRAAPGHAFEPNDVRALRNALERWTVDDLRLVWDHFQAGEGRTAVAKPSGWSTSWAAIANTKLPGRVRDAREWAGRGRPSAQTTGPPARAAPAEDALARRLRSRRPPTEDQNHG